MIRISCCIRQRQVYCHPKIFDRGLFDGLIFVDTYSAWSEKQDSEVADKVNGSVAHYWFPCLKHNLSRNPDLDDDDEFICWQFGIKREMDFFSGYFFIHLFICAHLIHKLITGGFSSKLRWSIYRTQGSRIRPGPMTSQFSLVCIRTQGNHNDLW